MRKKKSIGLICVLALSLAAASQARIVYIDATEGEGGNTALAAGGVFTSTADGSGSDNLWRGRAFGNGATIFESGGAYGDTANPEDCPKLVTTVSLPEDDYEVFAYFWSDGSQWRIRAALADAAELPLFKANDPNGAAVTADGKSFDAPVPILTEGNRTLWQVSLGTSGITKTVTVFIDDEANHLSNNARTWYDGIGVKALPRKINYVDASDGAAGNTALAAGGVFTGSTDGSGADNLWRFRPNLAIGGTVFESGGQYGETANPEDCPRLVTTVVVPENEYAVYAFFWSDGGQWRVRAALTNDANDLPLYLANDPNGAAVAVNVNDLAAPVLTTEGNRTLWQVFLGNTAMTTSISVFIDDAANHQSHTARTWFDGIGYKVITPIHYVDATSGDTGNTKLATGEVWTAAPTTQGTSGSGADGLWRERSGFGNNTIFEARGSWEANNTENAPRLATSVDVAENIYEVFAYFWDTNSTWRLAASLTNDANELPVYVPNRDEDPNIPTVAADAANFAAPVPVVTTSGGRVMWQIPLGRTAVTTKITVYVDDDISSDPANGGNFRSWFDGIGYRVASLYTPDAAPKPTTDEPVKPELSVDPGAAGLVAYYAFEGNTNDLSGNGLNGTLGGAPIYVAGPATYGQAMDFHAIANEAGTAGAAGDYVDLGNSTRFDFTDAMTVGVWVNIRSIPDEYRNIVSKGNSAWLLGTDGTTTGFQWMFAGNRGWLGANSKTKVPMNEWHYVCGTYDKAVGAVIYVDGELEATNGNKDGIDVNTLNVWIGANSDFSSGMYKPGRFFDGMIDEVRIYNRALSWAEVMFLAGE